MRIQGQRDEVIAIDVAREREEDDVRMSVRVESSGFVGTTDTWVLGEAWTAFLAALTTVERDRQGRARVESMSPGELELTIRSIDRAGHMVIEGLIGRVTPHGAARLTFPPLEIDPSELPRIVAELRAAAGPISPASPSG